MRAVKLAVPPGWQVVWAGLDFLDKQQVVACSASILTVK